MADIAYGAFGLSEEFLRAGHTLHCIQMLEGLCAQMDPSQDVFPPILQVKCRLRLAMIYAKYTDNTEKAKDHLVRAVSCAICANLCHANIFFFFPHSQRNDPIP